MHGISDVWNVISSVRFSRDEDLAVVQTEGIDEAKRRVLAFIGDIDNKRINALLPESKELLSHFNLIRCRRSAFLRAEASSSRLFDPDYICEIHPSLRHSSAFEPNFVNQVYSRKGSSQACKCHTATKTVRSPARYPPKKNIQDLRSTRSGSHRRPAHSLKGRTRRRARCCCCLCRWRWGVDRHMTPQHYRKYHISTCPRQ